MVGSSLYLLGCFDRIAAIPGYRTALLAPQVFGQDRFDAALNRIAASLRDLGYSQFSATSGLLPIALAQVLLANRNPALEAVSGELIAALYRDAVCGNHRGALYRLLSYALFAMDCIDRPIDHRQAGTTQEVQTQGIDAEWVQWCERWRHTSTLQPSTRQTFYRLLLRVGRWLATCHPEVTSPDQWTREVAAAYVAAVKRLRVGDWTHRLPESHAARVGQPLKPYSKEHFLGAARTFFRDCQQWGWVTRRFDPRRAFATPATLRRHLGPKPRTIADPLWAKLLWAGLNLTAGAPARSKTIYLFLRQIQETRRLYWAWTADQWLHFFNANPRLNTPGCERRCGQHLIGVAYLLTGFTDFQALSCYRSPAVLAARVFGRDRLDAAARRLDEALNALGYRRKKQLDTLKGPLGAAMLRVGSPRLEDITTEVLAALLAECTGKWQRQAVTKVS